MSLLSGLIRKTIYPMVLRHDGRESALKHWRFFEKSQYWSHQELVDYQWRKLKELLDYAYKKVPYYRRIFDERALTPNDIVNHSDLKKLPVLTRDDIRAYKDELTSSDFTRKQLQEFSTGGTTRRKMMLLRDYESSNIKAAAAWRFEGYMGRKPADKICFFWPVHIDYDPNVKLRTKLRNRYVIRELLFYAGAPSKETLEHFYRLVKSFKPEFFKAFPHALFSFADYVDKNRLPLPKIKAVMSTGEVLEPSMKRKFEDVFKAKVFNMYGSREVGNTASECEQHSGLHISMETSLVEFISDGKEVTVGEEGELIITDLTNYGFPMIRYAVEDFGCRIAEPCACGRNLDLMTTGIGRVLDRYVAPDGSRHSALALSAYISEEGPPLGQIQYRQKSLTHFHLKVTNDPPVTPKIENHIHDVFHHLVSPDVEVTIEPVEELPREPSGKIRYFICEI